MSAPIERWWHEPCDVWLPLTRTCSQCGQSAAEPPGLLAAGGTLHFTGQRIPKEE